MTRNASPSPASILRPARAALLGALGLLAASCAGPGKPVIEQQVFKSPEESVAALVAAMKADDLARLQTILGPSSEELLSSGDPVADRNARARFVSWHEEGNHLERVAEDKAVLYVGKEDWPLPIPVVRVEEGWIFDTEEGEEEIISRRIGRNELSAIEVCRAVQDAQREYAMEDRDGDGIREYARVFMSSPGKKDGLFWPSDEGEASPLGPLAAKAAKEEYRRSEGDGPTAYHGYFYRIITAQGASAPGGAYDYGVDGNLIGGAAILAYPAEYGSSGIMTFIADLEGRVWQKDLGEETAEAAPKVKTFDPDRTWTRVVVAPLP